MLPPRHRGRARGRNAGGYVVVGGEGNHLGTGRRIIVMQKEHETTGGIRAIEQVETIGAGGSRSTHHGLTRGRIVRKKVLQEPARGFPCPFPVKREGKAYGHIHTLGVFEGNIPLGILQKHTNRRIAHPGVQLPHRALPRLESGNAAMSIPSASAAGNTTSIGASPRWSKSSADRGSMPAREARSPAFQERFAASSRKAAAISDSVRAKRVRRPRGAWKRLR